MADYRLIKTKIWHDNWFLSLTQEEKLFWFFLLTNEFVHISGLYELPKTLISPLVGASNFEEMLSKFKKNGKILYEDGWILILNHIKHQSKQLNKKDNVFKAINNYFKENEVILAKFNLKPEYPYKPLISPLQAPTHPLPKDIDKDIDIDIVASDEEFNLSSKIKVMLEDKDKKIPIIANYWVVNDFNFTNKEQYQSALKRELIPARNLIGYKLEDLNACMNWLKKTANYKWTLETVNKFINNYIKDNNL